MNSFASLAKKGLSGVKTAAKVTAAALTAVSGGLIAAGGYAVSVGSNFEEGMSKVEAICGASADEIGRLTEKAKEMGAKTKFSATESAAAFQYMAMAGWKTEDMLDGIEGIMNLAAASGEDLAGVSDIVTDALTAFGLQAKDSAHFADVLAKASASSNTNVGLMGATFKYVAPIAGAMKYSIEDTAVAIGLMANAGIKGEQAGTSLRAMLTRLVKPPKDAAEALDDLNISATNADGTMRPLRDVLKDLREKFNGLDDSQKASYASSIAGTEAMSGLLAIVNASEEDFDKLAASIDHANGAATEQAETMQDNLKGAITILQSSLEGLGIEVYESMESPLRNATEVGIQYVGELTEAFQSGGLEGAVEKAGDIFAELATKAAEKAPAMVDTAARFMQAFFDGIVSHKKELLKSAKTVVITFAEGIADLLPASVSRPVKTAIKEIEKSSTSGGLKKAVSTGAKLLSEFAKAGTNLAKAVLPMLTKALDLLGNNLDKVIPLLVAAYTAIKGYSVIKTATGILNGMSSAWKATTIMLDGYLLKATAAEIMQALVNGQLTISGVLVGALTGKISLATAAQTLWNIAVGANPIGVLIVAVAALTAGLVAYSIIAQKNADDSYGMAAANEKLQESYANALQAASDFEQGISSAGSIFDGVNEAIIVSTEKQQELSDQMNEVQQQITAIAGTYADQRKELTESEVAELDSLFEKMRTLAAEELEYQSAYAEVVQQRAELLANTHEGTAEEYAASSQKIINSAAETRDAVISKAEEQLNSELAMLQMRLNNDQTYTTAMYDAEAKAAQEKYDLAVEKANATTADTVKIIQDGYQKRATALQESLQKQKDLRQQEYEENAAYDERMRELDEQTKTASLEQHKGLLAERFAEEERHKAEMERIGAELSASMSTEAENQAGVLLSMAGNVELYGGQIEGNTEAMVDQIIANLDEMEPEAKESMNDAMQGMLDGMSQRESELYAKAEGIANGVIARLRKALDEHSPSKKTRKIFQYAMEGAELGLKDLEPSLYKHAGGIAGRIIDTFRGIEPALPEISDRMRRAMIEQADKVTAEIPRSVPQKPDTAASGDGRRDLSYERLEEAVRNGMEGLRFEFNERSLGKLVREEVRK